MEMELDETPQRGRVEKLARGRLEPAEYQGEGFIIHRRGKDSEAIISIEDLRLFERLLEDAEDRLDVVAAQTALAESDERIPYEDFRRRQGLKSAGAKKRPSSKAGAETV